MPQLAAFRKWTWSEHLDGAVAEVEREITGTATLPSTPPTAAPTPFP